MLRNTAIFAFVVLAGCHKHAPVAQKPVSPAPGQTNTDTRERTAENNRVTPTTTRESTPSSDSSSRVADAIKALNDALADAFFDFDRYSLRDDAIKALTGNASVLRQAMTADHRLTLTVEGYCDERGSSEYNMALGDRRAQQAKEFLQQLGLTGDQIKTISYGAERPVCKDSNEECWQKNRRAHVTYAYNGRP